MSLPDYVEAGRFRRPIGISILSVLHIIGGIGTLALSVVIPILATKKPEIVEGLASVGIPIPLLIVGMLIIAVLALGSGIGMWTGAKWGWYLASFYYVYSIVRNVSAIFSLSSMFEMVPAEEVADMRHGPGFYYFKFGFRAVVHALILIYFYKQSVREYFRVEKVKSWKVVSAEIGVCIAIAIAFSSR